MQTRRKFMLFGLSIPAAFVGVKEAEADTPPIHRPPQPPRKPMPVDYVITQREDMYLDMPIKNKNGTIPDPTAITGCKLSVYDAFGGTQFLVDVSLGAGITVALGTDDAGNTCCIATAHWTPTQSIATRVLTQQLTCVGTLNVQAGGIITQPDQSLRITIMPATTVGV